jgi:hypothetical protein
MLFVRCGRKVHALTPSPRISAFTRVFDALCGGGLGWGHEARAVFAARPLPVPPPQAGEGTTVVTAADSSYEVA